MSSFLQLISPALSWNCQVYESESSTGGNAKAPTKLTERGHRCVAKHGAQDGRIHRIGEDDRVFPTKTKEPSSAFKTASGSAPPVTGIPIGLA
jgi:hypothetical protein